MKTYVLVAAAVEGKPTWQPSTREGGVYLICDADLVIYRMSDYSDSKA